RELAEGRERVHGGEQHLQRPQGDVRGPRAGTARSGGDVGGGGERGHLRPPWVTCCHKGRPPAGPGFIGRARCRGDRRLDVLPRGPPAPSWVMLSPAYRPASALARRTSVPTCCFAD